jgi:DNA-directed RNA polymerase subunit RPC12/RpoP
MVPADAPHPKPPTMTKAPPVGRKFPCPACGAKLDFNPTARALKCPYCGHVEKIQPNSAEVEEHDFDAYVKHQTGANKIAIAGRSEQVRCPGCGAVVLLEDKVATDHCPYCSTHLENKPESADDMIPPESLLPFAVDQRAARAAFGQWIGSLWFAPGELKKLADLGQLSGVYVPFWTYDSMTYTHYTGQRGDDYQETETYTEQDSDGNTVTKTRTVTNTRWTWVSGEVQHFFDDVLVCASKGMPDQLVCTLEPWDLKALEGFKPEFLSGFKTERYAVGLEEGFGRAREIMEVTIRRLCCEDIGGNHQQLADVKTKHMGVTFKHLLLPVWVASYRYRDNLFQILVNARTGEVVGRRPYSVAKIMSLIAAIVVIALLTWYLIAKAIEGPHNPRPRGARVAAGIAPSPQRGQGRGEGVDYFGMTSLLTPNPSPQRGEGKVIYPGCAYAATTAFADRSPSTAALTIPPAYPAPSPTG